MDTVQLAISQCKATEEDDQSTRSLVPPGSLVGGYVPCHWKGFAVLLGGIGIGGASAFAGLISGQHSSLLYGICFAFFVAVILAMVMIARRHSNW
jgi:hypothetical protein